MATHTVSVSERSMCHTTLLNVYGNAPKQNWSGWFAAGSLTRVKDVAVQLGCAQRCASLSLPTRSPSAPQGHVTNPRGTGIAPIPIAAAGIGYTAAPSCSSASSTNRSCARPHSPPAAPTPPWPQGVAVLKMHCKQELYVKIHLTRLTITKLNG